MKQLTILLGLLLPLLLSAQVGRLYTSGQEEYFVLGHLPDMRAEAMGRAQVALGGDILQNYSNPASLGGIEYRSLALSSSGPFYLLRESDYGYLGFAQRLDNLPLVVGVSARTFFIGPSSFDATIDGERYELDLARTTNATFSAAYEVLPGLSVGLNANLYRLRLFRDAKAGHMPHFDLGLRYVKALPEGQNLSLGLSVNNFLFGRIAYHAPNGDQDAFNMPAVLRAGASYSGERGMTLPGAGRGSLRYLLTLEMQDFLNSRYHTAFRAGGELELFDVLALRLGYWRMSLNDRGQTVNFDRARDFTYGFGLIVPLDKWFGEAYNTRLYLDYTSLRPAATSSFSSSRMPNSRGLSLRLQWNLN